MAQRLDFWRAVLAESFVALEMLPRGTFRDGTVRVVELGALQVVEVGGSPQQVRRTASMIRRDDPGHLKVGLQLSGRGLVGQDGREALLGPGDLAAFDTSRPYQLAFDEPFRMLIAICPRPALPVPSRTLSRMSAVRIDGQGEIGALVAPFLVGLGGGPVGVGPAAEHLAEATFELLAAALDPGDAPALRAGPEVLARQVRRYIEQHLTEPDLGPDSVAGAHHISTRYLRKLFERDGETVGGFIRQRRLERCRRDLRDPAMHTVPVGAVAARWGLLDTAHFSRTFRRVYGVSPSEYRAAAESLRLTQR